jgi:GGDEF domain-containing protein
MATADVGEATSLEELWAAADAAMYDVKRAGGDAVGIAPRGPDPPSR